MTTDTTTTPHADDARRPTDELRTPRLTLRRWTNDDDVDAAHTGRGYVTEAARAILDEALAGGLRRVVAVTDLDNHASQRVARRIGMHHVGRARVHDDQELEFFVS